MRAARLTASTALRATEIKEISSDDSQKNTAR